MRKIEYYYFELRVKRKIRIKRISCEKRKNTNSTKLWKKTSDFFWALYEKTLKAFFAAVLEWWRNQPK